MRTLDILAVVFVLLLGAPVARAEGGGASYGASICLGSAAGGPRFVPCPSKSPQIAVPDLSTPKMRARFEGAVTRLCRTAFRIDVSKRPSKLSEGAMIGPSNPVQGSLIGCGVGVGVTLSSGPVSFAVPDLSTPELRARFEGYVTKLCQTPFSLDLSKQPSNLSDGMMIGPSNPARGSVIGCGDGVAVTVSTGPVTFTVPDLRTPVAREHFEAAVTKLCQTPFSLNVSKQPSALSDGVMIGPSDPARGSVIRCGDSVGVTVSTGPVKFTVPNLSTPGRRQRFETAVAAGCGTGFKVGVQYVESQAKRGVEVGPSDPGEGSVIKCNEPVTVPLSSGPTPARAALTVPDLSAPEMRARFANDMTNLCGAPFSLGVSYASSNLPKGSLIGDSRPARGSTVRCGDSVAVTLSNGAALWPRLAIIALAAVLVVVAGVAVWPRIRDAFRAMVVRTPKIISGSPEYSSTPPREALVVALQRDDAQVTTRPPSGLSVRKVHDA